MKRGEPGWSSSAKRHDVGAGDLGGVGLEPGRVAGPHHHRRDHEARARRVVVEQPDDGVRPDVQPELLVQLAPRRVLGRLPLVDAPARQRPLAGVVAQLAGPSRDQEAVDAVLVRAQRGRHGRRPVPAPVDGDPRKRAATRARISGAHPLYPTRAMADSPPDTDEERAVNAARRPGLEGAPAGRRHGGFPRAPLRLRRGRPRAGAVGHARAAGPAGRLAHVGAGRRAPRRRVDGDPSRAATVEDRRGRAASARRATVAS